MALNSARSLHNNHEQRLCILWHPLNTQHDYMRSALNGIEMEPTLTTILELCFCMVRIALTSTVP
jgi:hypothetical protein